MVRNILVTVDGYGGTDITEAQYAGVQGEHNMCQVTFDVTALTSENYAYRGEFVDGNGWGWSTDLLTPVTAGSTTTVSYLFPDAWTTAGGRGVARLVASKIVDNLETERVYVIDVPVYFKSKQEIDPQAGKDLFAGMSVLLSEIHDAIDDADTATANANTATTNANSAANTASANGTYAKNQGDYAKGQGDYVKAQGDAAKGAAATATASAAFADEKATYAQGRGDYANQQGQYASAKGAEATLAAHDATTAATTATNAAAAANAAAGAATGAAQDANEAAAAAEQAIADITGTLALKADIDGTYDELTAGNAKQLVSTVFATDKAPYLFRTSGGSIDIGDRENDTLVGGTVVWNQLISESNVRAYNSTVKTRTPQKVVIVPNGDYSSTLHYGVAMDSSAQSNIPLNHVLFFSVDCMSTQSDKFRARVGNSMFWSASVNANTIVHINGIARFASRTLTVYANDDTLYSTTDEITFQNLNIFDLTQMFGSTIADYIYSLEQSNAGAGVAWFRKLFPKDYYPYNAGELMSVNTTAHKTVGFNAWDEEWEVGSISAVTGENQEANTCIRSTNYIRLIPGKQYYFKGSFGNGVMWYDANKQFAGATLNALNNVLTIPDGAHYCRFVLDNSYGTTYNHDICVNLSWDGERDGAYARYEEHTYPLDGDLTLRGIPKLDENNNLYYDGDTYEADGTVTRYYGTRAYQSGDATGATMITDGTTTVYELATPTVETADPFADPQIVDDFGTEEYIDTRAVPIPVGHTTKYQPNLRAKLEMAPNSPKSDGDYVVRRANGVNTYVPLTLPAELPEAPAADGTYTLTVTVTDGVATYSWEA